MRGNEKAQNHEQVEKSESNNKTRACGRLLRIGSKKSNKVLPIATRA